MAQPRSRRGGKSLNASFGKRVYGNFCIRKTPLNFFWDCNFKSPSPQEVKTNIKSYMEFGDIICRDSRVARDRLFAYNCLIGGQELFIVCCLIGLV